MWIIHQSSKRIIKLIRQAIDPQIFFWILWMIHAKSCVSSGFRREDNAQYCLMEMTEKWCKFLDIWGHTGVLLTDLFKAFDCIDHELLIAKTMCLWFWQWCTKTYLLLP